MMLRVLISIMLSAYATSAFGQLIDFKKTKAHVTFDAGLVPWDGGPVLYTTLKIQGEINRDAVVLVKRYYDTLVEITRRYREEQNSTQSGNAINISLNSLGGDLDASIEIGRFVREKGANVLVEKEAQCASACIFILAGGIHRTVLGKLGVHRIFLDTPATTMTVDSIKKTMTRRQEQLRAYFRETNISERLADDMMMIPSAEIKWLSPQEIAIYGLGVDDPVYTEAARLTEAQKYGLPRMEYEARRQRAQQLCQSFAGYSACSDNVMRGLPYDTIWPSRETKAK